MIKHILTYLLLFTLPLVATQEVKTQAKPTSSALYAGCGGCCPNKPPSMAELLQAVELVLKNRILQLPEVQPLVVQELLVPNLTNPAVIQQMANAIAAGLSEPTIAQQIANAIAEAGIVGGALDFADFYALMPPDNAATVAPGTNVDFPRNGPSSGTGLIARIDEDQFNLARIGVYQVLFQVSVVEPGQLVLTLDSGAGPEELAYTVVGRDTGTSQIVGMALVRTTVINSILAVSNPTSESTALIIQPDAGGTEPVSAHLVITRLQ